MLLRLVSYPSSHSDPARCRRDRRLGRRTSHQPPQLAGLTLSRGKPHSIKQPTWDKLLTYGSQGCTTWSFGSITIDRKRTQGLVRQLTTPVCFQHWPSFPQKARTGALGCNPLVLAATAAPPRASISSSRELAAAGWEPRGVLLQHVVYCILPWALIFQPLDENILRPWMKFANMHSNIIDASRKASFLQSIDI